MKPEPNPTRSDMAPCLRSALLALVLITIIATGGEPSVAERRSVPRPPMPFIIPSAPQWDEMESAVAAFLSIADGVAVTAASFPKVPDAPGIVQFWDAKTGRSIANVVLPAPVKAMTGARGRGRIVLSGGEKSDTADTRYLWLLDGTGTVLAELLPKHTDPYDLSLKIDPEGKRAIAYTGNSTAEDGYWLYEFVSPDLPPVAVDGADFDALAPEPEPLPDLSLEAGVSAITHDEGYLLVTEGGGSKTGIRDLKGGKTTLLGQPFREWLDWSVSSKGRHFVTWTADREDGLTVWSLADLRSQVIDDPLFVPEITPALSPDGAWLRYARAAGSSKFEIVSYLLSTSTTRVDWQGGNETGVELRPGAGKFSANGQHLCFFHGEEIWEMSWDDEGAPTAVKSPMSLPANGLGWQTVSAVSDDGKHCLFSGLSGTVDMGSYVQEWVEMSTGTTLKKWSISGMHGPHVHAAFHPRTGALATCYYLSGPSLGYYQGEVELHEGPGIRIPEYSAVEMNSGGKYRDEYGDVLPEDDPNGRKAHALAIQFVQTAVDADPLLAIYANNGCFRTWDPATRKFVHQYYWNEHTSAVYPGSGPAFQNLIAGDGGRAFLPLQGGGIRLLKLPVSGGPKVLADLWRLPGSGLLAVVSDGSYDCPEGGEDQVLIREGAEWMALGGKKDRERIRAALAE